MGSLSTLGIAGLAARCTFGGALAAGLGLFILPKEPEILPSPRDTVLSWMPQADKDWQPYPPDALPGARDVDTPHGSIRVYEWGPEDGRKVLLIHGISTPSIALGPLAHQLVERGCRVMLFDLFGRGLSSTPNPTKYPQNNLLFTTQIHMVLTSSPLSWTGATTRFTLIGYSLGGALAADFTSYFPSLVNHLVLIAPGGLIRKSHITWKSKLLYSRFLPERVMQWLVAKRLWTGPQTKRGKEPNAKADAEKQGKGGLRSKAVYLSSSLPLLPGRPRSTVSGVVDWQIKHHPGFIPSFVSSMRYAPIHGQQARWEVIGQRLSRQRVVRRDAQWEEHKREEVEKSGLEKGKVLMILGERDPIIVAEEVEADAKEVFGEEGVDVRVVKGAGHEVPIERVEEVAGIIEGFWRREDVVDLEGSYGDVVGGGVGMNSSPVFTPPSSIS